MNFFPAQIQKTDGKLFVDTGDFQVEIPKGKAGIYEQHTNKEVAFGIRPEDIYNPEFPSPGIQAASVNCKVDLLELIGDEIYVYLMAGMKNLVARVDPRSNYKVGEKARVAFDMSNFHIFDVNRNP